jgi:DNA invertase Pin-like site-specific DNA recombinase
LSDHVANPAAKEDLVADLTKGRRVTGAERDKLASDLKKKYESGVSIRALASSTGRSYGFVHRILNESGATLRGRGGATRGKKK